MTGKAMIDFNEKLGDIWPPLRGIVRSEDETIAQALADLAMLGIGVSIIYYGFPLYGNDRFSASMETAWGMAATRHADGWRDALYLVFEAAAFSLLEHLKEEQQLLDALTPKTEKGGVK